MHDTQIKIQCNIQLAPNALLLLSLSLIIFISQMMIWHKLPSDYDELIESYLWKRWKKVEKTTQTKGMPKKNVDDIYKINWLKMSSSTKISNEIFDSGQSTVDKQINIFRISDLKRNKILCLRWFNWFNMGENDRHSIYQTNFNDTPTCDE